MCVHLFSCVSGLIVWANAAAVERLLTLRLMLLLATKAEEENGLANYLSTILFGKEILPGISTVFHHLTFIHVQNFHPETFS